MLEKQLGSIKLKHFRLYHLFFSKEQGEIWWWKMKQQRYVRSTNIVTTCLMREDSF